MAAFYSFADEYHEGGGGELRNHCTMYILSPFFFL